MIRFWIDAACLNPKSSVLLLWPLCKKVLLCPVRNRKEGKGERGKRGETEEKGNRQDKETGRMGARTRLLLLVLLANCWNFGSCPVNL